MQQTPKAGWYAVRVPPRHVKFHADKSGEFYFPAERMMKRLGLEVFFPTMQLWRWRNKFAKEKTLISYPLIAPYVFVLTGAIEDWLRLFTLDYGRAVVGDGERPQEIPASKIDWLREKHAEGQWRAPDAEKFMQTYGEYKEGDEVFPERGVYAGRRIRVGKFNLETRRAEIKLVMFGAERVAEIPLSDLVKAK